MSGGLWFHQHDFPLRVFRGLRSGLQDPRGDAPLDEYRRLWSVWGREPHELGCGAEMLLCMALTFLKLIDANAREYVRDYHPTDRPTH